LKISAIGKDSLAIVATLDDVLWLAGDDEAGKACHEVYVFLVN